MGYQYANPVKGRTLGTYVYPRPINIKDAATGDPAEREKSTASHDETNDRRAIRQAIMTQYLREIADEIIGSGATVTSYDDKGNLKKNGTLKDLYDKDTKNEKFPLLRDLITKPEEGFNSVRDRLSVGENFGSINLAVFRSAMALGQPEDVDNVDVEEVAKRVVIRAGLSGGYRRKLKAKGIADSGFAGCK